MNPKVDEFIANQENRQDELTELRRIILDCGLEEEFKWKQPCYTYKNKNIFILSAFKNYCAISFFKGVLLKDTEGILYKHGEQSQSTRSIRFNNMRQIIEKEHIIKTYVFEAVEIEKSGLKIEFKKVSDYEIPPELNDIFEKKPALKNAFEALTPGRQKGYLLYFSQAKQSETRISRIEKYIQRILSGKGINDCICGHSKRMPVCDGSHKDL